MAKYILKSDKVDAFQWNGPNSPKPKWLTNAINRGDVYYQGGDNPYLTVKIYDHVWRVNVGDFIIHRVAGKNEFVYSCESEFFEENYRPIDGDKAKYILKRDGVDAHQLNDANVMPEWLTNALISGDVRYENDGKPHLAMNLVGREMRAYPGDYVLYDGRYVFPYNADVFNEKYELIDG